MTSLLQTLIRHEGEAPRERSTCGWRDRLISREDSNVTAWVHAVDIDGAREHYHKVATELYYVLEGEGHLEIDNDKVPLKPGVSVLIPPNTLHRAVGKLKVINVPIPPFDPEDEWFVD